MKQFINAFLKLNFPGSNLSMSHFEIETKVHTSVNLGLGFKNSVDEMSTALKMAIELFESLFKDETQKVWIIINEYSSLSSNYLLEQFDNLKNNYYDENVYDEYLEKNRGLFILHKNRNQINYSKFFQAIINCEDKVEPMIKERIFFIEPNSKIVFMLWDSVIEIGTNQVSDIKWIYEKYYPFFNDFARKRINKHLKDEFKKG